MGNEIAELKHLTQKEMETYKLSLKNNFFLRDMAKCERMDERMETSRRFAIKLLQKKTPIEDVVYLTELTREQVQELLKQD